MATVGELEEGPEVSIPKQPPSAFLLMAVLVLPPPASPHLKKPCHDQGKTSKSIYETHNLWFTVSNNILFL